MLDIKLSELILVFIVALLVIGPKNLSKTMKSVLISINIFRKYILKIKADFIDELNLQEIEKKTEVSCDDIKKI